VNGTGGAGGQGIIVISYTPDTTPPVISAIATSTTASHATVSWTTDELSSTLVKFGPTSSYASTTPESNTSPRVTSHSITVVNLLPCSLYHYLVQSIDASSNTATSSDDTFTTTGCSGGATIIAKKQGDIATSTGGSLTQGALHLVVPKNFTTASSTVTFQANQLNGTTFFQNVTPPSGRSSVGTTVFHLTALDSATTSVSTFDTPLTVTLTYDPADLGSLDPTTLTIYRYDGTTWTALTNCSVDTTAHTVSCETSNFSDFSIFGSEAAAAAASSGGNGPLYSGPASALPGYIAPKEQTIAPDGTITYATTTSSTPTPGTQSLIQALVAQLQSLIAQLKALGGTVSASLESQVNALAGTSNTPPPTFAKDLQLNDHGADVQALQVFLNAHGFTIAAEGPGSAGQETDTFGPATYRALIKFQEANGITPARGYFGPVTRKVIGTLQ
jgi:hypothetical protein